MSEENKISEQVENEKKAPAVMTSAWIFEWAGTIITALVVVVLLLTFVVRQVTVKGSSMTNTLKNGDRLVVTNFMYNTPQSGDIIVISHGNDYNEPIIKRVIATGGQSLSINYDTGEVVVDGVILDEEYIKGKTQQIRNPLEIPSVIPEGYVFVMGDNREGSLDSRSTEIGLIPLENIIGKAEFRIYPLDTFGGLY